jgi:hypothetical protein
MFDRDAVTGSPTVEVGHEALLREWSRLEAWIREARQDLLRHASFVNALVEWERVGGDPGYLVTGARLAEYQTWASSSTIELNARELEFLDAAVEARDADARADRERAEREQSLAGRARRRLWGLVAAAVVIVALGTWAVIAGGGGDVIIAPTQTTLDPAVLVDPVLAYIDALNDGDLDRWLSTLSEDYAQTVQITDTYDTARTSVNANIRLEIVEPCGVIEPSSSGIERVQCTITYANDFHDTGGVSPTVITTFFVDENGKIRLIRSEGDDSAQFEFTIAFWDWLEVAHPDVYAPIKPAHHTSVAGFRSDTFDRHPEDMFVVLEYVDEFVAQSAVYPVDSNT